MKYSEFEDILEHYGYLVDQNNYDLHVKNIKGKTLIYIDKEYSHSTDTGYIEFLSLPNIEKDFLLDIVMDIVKTPLAEREEEKKYRVKFPSITRWGNAVYLQKDTGDKDPIGVDWSPEDFIFDEKPTDYIFTEQEIKDIDERYLAFKVEVTPE